MVTRPTIFCDTDPKGSNSKIKSMKLFGDGSYLQQHPKYENVQG